MAKTARNEMEPAAPKNENLAASETRSRHAIDSPWWQRFGDHTPRETDKAGPR